MATTAFSPAMRSCQTYSSWCPLCCGGLETLLFLVKAEFTGVVWIISSKKINRSVRIHRSRVDHFIEENKSKCHWHFLPLRSVAFAIYRVFESDNGNSTDWIHHPTIQCSMFEFGCLRLPVACQACPMTTTSTPADTTHHSIHHRPLSSCSAHNFSCPWCNMVSLDIISSSYTDDCPVYAIHVTKVRSGSWHPRVMTAVWPAVCASGCSFWCFPCCWDSHNYSKRWFGVVVPFPPRLIRPLMIYLGLSPSCGDVYVFAMAIGSWGCRGLPVIVIRDGTCAKSQVSLWPPSCWRCFLAMAIGYTLP